MEENKEGVPQSRVMMLSPQPAFRAGIIPNPVAKCEQKTPQAGVGESSCVSTHDIAFRRSAHQTRNPLFSTRFGRQRGNGRSALPCGKTHDLPVAGPRCPFRPWPRRVIVHLHARISRPRGASKKPQVLDAKWFEVVGCDIDQARYSVGTRTVCRSRAPRNYKFRRTWGQRCIGQ